MALTLLCIALGGALGAVSRYQVVLFFARRERLSFPHATLIVNVAGSFAIGVVTAILQQHLATEGIWHSLVVVGFLGALTTFSTFSLDTFLLILQKNLYTTLTNITCNLILGLSAVAIGYFLFT